MSHRSRTLSLLLGGALVCVVIPGAPAAAATPPVPAPQLRLFCEDLRRQLAAPNAKQIQLSLFESPPGAPVGWGAMYFAEKLTFYAQSCPFELSELNKLRAALGLAPLKEAPLPPSAPRPSEMPPPSDAPTDHSPGIVPPNRSPGALPPGRSPGIVPPNRSPGAVPAATGRSPGIVPPNRSPGALPPAPAGEWPGPEALLSNQVPPGVRGQPYVHVGDKNGAQLRNDSDFTERLMTSLGPSEVVEIFESHRLSEDLAGSGKPSAIVSRKYVIHPRAGSPPRTVRVVTFSRYGLTDSITEYDVRTGAVSVIRGSAPHR